MRKLLLGGVLALGLAGTPETNAEIKPSIYIVGPEEKQFGILVEADSNEQFDIRFIDADGLILHKEYKLKDYYAKRFDLRQLKPGNYTLEIENANQISSFAIKVANKSISIDANSKEIIEKPRIKVDGNRIRLTMATSELPVQVKIFNRYGELIHEEAHRGIDQINTVYDLSLHGGGSYRVQILFNSRSFSETVGIGW